MPVVSEDIWSILYTVSRYLFPLLALSLVFVLLLYVLSESSNRRERTRGLPGSGTVGELIVLSGGRDLDANTWFPVPREGVLGSIRSCDLVIPCSGVKTKHLDFSWEDGQGLLIRPRTGCEALINGTLVTCRSDASSVPLTHGAVLQVGDAVLRLHLFAALDNTVSTVQQLSPESPYGPEPSAPVPLFAPAQPAQMPLPVSPEAYAPSPVPAVYIQQAPVQAEPFFPRPVPAPPVPDENAAPPETEPVRLRRSDRWKEDLGE